MLAVTNGCVGGNATSLRKMPPADPPKPDYAALHDEFLDSLLHEQQAELAARGSQEDDIVSDPGLNHSVSTESSTHSWTLSPASSNSSLSDIGVGGSSSRKRRRGLLVATTMTVPRRDPNLIHPPAFTPSKLSVLGTVTAVTNNSKIAMKPPEFFLHSAVRMQKDKGKGDEVGSKICAKGIPACLGKLREKMLLLTEHCQPGTTVSASMKRRNAVISELYDNFVETRSLLTLRMGFLTMTYGILLRWDTGKTGLVTVVVLRKNCHESFYKKRSTSATVGASSCCAAPPVSPATSLDEDEDDVLQPPYLVPRPANFPPSEITVSVLYATGLHKKSHWTVQLQLADQTENILLAYDGNVMLPKLGGPLQYSVARSSASTAVLEIRLLEHKVRRKTRVLRSSMVLPLHSLEAVSSDLAEHPTSMRIPCPDGATIQIEAMLVSDQAIWQRREVAARRKKSGDQRSPITVVHHVDEEDASSPWDWICMLC